MLIRVRLKLDGGSARDFEIVNLENGIIFNGHLNNPIDLTKSIKYRKIYIHGERQILDIPGSSIISEPYTSALIVGQVNRSYIVSLNEFVLIKIISINKEYKNKYNINIDDIINSFPNAKTFCYCDMCENNKNKYEDENCGQDYQISYLRNPMNYKPVFCDAFSLIRKPKKKRHPLLIEKKFKSLWPNSTIKVKG